MLKTLLTKVFGTRFDREVKKIQPIVDAIKAHEKTLADYSEDQL
jgi:preprotein translocase subunit SecA